MAITLVSLCKRLYESFRFLMTHKMVVVVKIVTRQISLGTLRLGPMTRNDYLQLVRRVTVMAVSSKL